MNIRLTGLQFSALLQSFFPPLNNFNIRASLHGFGISLWVREALNNSVIASVTSFEVSFNILAGISSGPLALYTFKSSRSFFTPSIIIVILSISNERGNLISGTFRSSIEKIWITFVARCYGWANKIIICFLICFS